MNLAIRNSSCKCGKVRCVGVGPPIVSAVCYCTDCQEGGRRIEALPDAPPVCDPDGGTPYLTYRTDRFRCIAGADLLVAHKIKESAPTQRFVASCCNTAMYLKFGPGHWISAYRSRFEGDAPAIEFRNKMARRRSATPIPNDAPSHAGYPMVLFWRLIQARFAMMTGQ